MIVHLYEEYGAEFVQHLRGMFAIALWDKRDETLVLVRDRLGIKPLYYAALGDRLVFGSELKPLMTDGVPRDIDRQALHDYLSLNYVPGPRTIFSRREEAPARHRLIARRGQRHGRAVLAAGAGGRVGPRAASSPWRTTSSASPSS